MVTANFQDFVTVGQCGAMLIMYIYVTVAMGRILWQMFKRRKDVASNFTPTLIFHIFMWFIAGITGVVCNAYHVIAFHSDKPYAITPYFWVNIPNFTAIFCAVTAGIFLVIDRICMVSLKPSRYDRIKSRLLIFDIISVSATLIVGIILYIAFGKAGNAYVFTMRCGISSNGVAFTILYRYVLEVIYSILGVVCLLLLRKFNKNLGKLMQTDNNQHKGEAMVKFTIYTNIFVETIPCFLGYLFMDILHIPVQNYLGVFTRVFAIINGTICAWKYTKSLKMMDNTQRVGNHTRSVH
uniref:G_PROTEIN_RECEP_F1_2 domain-containing protein n=1 Tax=Panagrellus redivivus TaxID=6233 RepID=A0A7E4UMP1_PANRE